MKKRFQITPASYIIFRRDNKILMLRRYNTGYSDGNYSLPSGHFEANESARATAQREAFEEVGVTIQPKDLHFVHVLHRKAQEKDHERVDFFFETHKWQGELVNKEPHKCDDLKWFDIKKLPPNIVQEVAHVMTQLAQGKSYSDLDL